MGFQDVGFFYVNKMGTKWHSGDVHMGLRLRMQDLVYPTNRFPTHFWGFSYTILNIVAIIPSVNNKLWQ